MFALDNRTGNVLTTVALFAAIGAAVYAVRTTLIVLVLALLFAYLLEPAVDWVHGLFPSHPASRSGAIAIVYMIGALLVAAGAYTLAPTIVGQMTRLNEALPDLIARARNTQFLEQHSASIASAVQRFGPAAGSLGREAGWLLTVPIVAIFFLNNRVAFLDGTVEILARRRDKASVKRTVDRIDTMLAQYLRAQLTLAGLSTVFYSVSMLLLGFPFPLALGVLGGALEFLPAIGWVLATVAILTSGWLTHAPWILMGGLIVVWRLVQDLVNSPRIFGNRLELDPIVVILALMLGGQIGGILGVVLSVPAVAVLRIIWNERSSRENAAAA